MKANKGISLIVLVITIIVIIILAGAVILNLTTNNPMDSAKVAKVTQERESLESSITLYLAKVIAATSGDHTATEILTGAVTTPVAYPTLVTDTVVSGVNANTFKLDTASTLTNLDMTLPTTPTGSSWCVDVATGKCFLVFESTATIPTYLTNYTTNTTLAFVKKL